MYELTKEFRFEAAHRLAKGYEGKCANIHGHSWNGIITITSKDLNGLDMAVDFKTLGVFCQYIINKFDHTIILQEDDVELRNLCTEKGWVMVIMESNPTCEALAKLICSEAVAFFAKMRIQVKSVTIKETCTTSCTYNPNGK